ncbi:hypothetical protein JW905_09055 [bacterium]|nr:hypothetical protein [candidate division CSSED10-310 bacterium]
MNRGITLTVIVFCLVPAFALPVAADYWPADQPVPDAATARINDSGLFEIATFLAGYITPQMVFEMMPNPIIDEDWGISEILVYATGVSFNTPIYLNIDSQVSNRLLFQGTINNFTLFIDLYGRLLPFPACDSLGSIYISNIGISAYVYATAGAAGHIDVVIDVEDGGITIGNLSIDLNDPICDLIYDFLFSTLNPVIRSILVTTLQDVIEQDVANQVEELLNELPFNFQFELMGVTLDIGLNAQDITMDANGMNIWLRGDVSSDTTSDCVPPQPGSYFTPSDRPGYGLNVPFSNPPVPYEAAMAINDDLLNRALYTAYNSGLMCIFLDPQAMEDFGLPFPITSALFAAAVPRLNEIAQNAPMTLIITPNEQPVVSYNMYTNPFPLEMWMHELDMEVYIYAWERWMHLFTLRVNVDDIQADVEITPEDMIHITLDENISVTNTVIWDELLNLTPQERANVESILPTVVGMILPILLDSIEDFPLPSFEQFAISVTDIVTHGSRNYLGIFGDLVFREADRSLKSDAVPLRVKEQAQERLQ